MPGPFPYDPNIPQPNDQLSVSQGDILLNFQGLNNILNVNHVDFAQADAGKHKWLSMPTQVVNPGTTATEAAVFSSSTLGVIDLFFRRQNNGAIFNMTGSDRTTAGSNNILISAGYTYLPSGLLLKWGTAKAAAPFPGGFKTIPFPGLDNGGAAIPAFTNVLGGLVCPVSDLTHFVGLNSYTALNFVLAVGSASANLNFTYFFIGY